jgi:hypothetical protein
MPDWLYAVGATLPAQLRAGVLTAIAAALWFACLRMAMSRNGDVTRWFVYGIIGLCLTLLGIAALDNGASWFFLEIILSLFACLGFLIELRALRTTERPPAPEVRPPKRKPIRENP